MISIFPPDRGNTKNDKPDSKFHSTTSTEDGRLKYPSTSETCTNEGISEYVISDHKN